MIRHSFPRLIRPVLIGSLCAAAALSGCGSDDDSSAPTAGNAGLAGSAGRPTESGDASDGAGHGGDSGAGALPSGGSTGSLAQAGSAGEAGSSARGDVARGQYLVQHVAACGDCHTPRDAMGTPDLSKYLAGSAHFADLDPTSDQKGNLPTPNLTPDPDTGLGAWTDAEIKKAFQDGIDKDGKALFSIMPYYVFHNMSDADADAIVAYLRSVPAIVNELPERQDLGFPVTQAQPVPPEAIPETTLAVTDPKYPSAENGRYLAGFAGACLDCHTEHVMAAVPLKIDQIYQGKGSFSRAELGLPQVFPDNIVSSNLTPSENGLKGWTAADVAKTLHQGVDNQGKPLCPPMPFGPNGAFGGLTAQDALDIGVYFTSLAPHDNGAIALCVAPGAPIAAGEGGVGGQGSAP